MTDTKLKEESGKLTHTEASPTAATVGNRLYGPSGAMDYRVILGAQGGGKKFVTVNAATGDEAAQGALEKNPGWKVASVFPASDPSNPLHLSDDAE